MLGQIDGSHAAASDRPEQSIRAEHFDRWQHRIQSHRTSTKPRPRSMKQRRMTIGFGQHRIVARKMSSRQRIGKRIARHRQRHPTLARLALVQMFHQLLESSRGNLPRGDIA